MTSNVRWFQAAAVDSVCYIRLPRTKCTVGRSMSASAAMRSAALRWPRISYIYMLPIIFNRQVASSLVARQSVSWPNRATCMATCRVLAVVWHGSWHCSSWSQVSVNVVAAVRGNTSPSRDVNNMSFELILVATLLCFDFTTSRRYHYCISLYLSLYHYYDFSHFELHTRDKPTHSVCSVGLNTARQRILFKSFLWRIVNVTFEFWASRRTSSSAIAERPRCRVR